MFWAVRVEPAPDTVTVLLADATLKPMASEPASVALPPLEMESVFEEPSLPTVRLPACRVEPLPFTVMLFPAEAAPWPRKVFPVMRARPPSAMASVLFEPAFPTRSVPVLFQTEPAPVMVAVLFVLAALVPMRPLRVVRLPPLETVSVLFAPLLPR